MSSGYNERPPGGGYPQQGYPGQGYAPPVGPRPQGPSHAAPPPAPAAASRPGGAPAWLVWVVLVIALLNLVITAWMAYQLIQAANYFNELGASLSGLGS